MAAGGKGTAKDAITDPAKVTAVANRMATKRPRTLKELGGMPHVLDNMGVPGARGGPWVESCRLRRS